MQRFSMLVGVVCLLLGWMVGQAVHAQNAVATEGAEWRHWRTGTSGVNGIYHVRTGKVYRILGSCGREEPAVNGSLVPLPTVRTDPDFNYSPSPR